ncbi:MAG: glycosyltransferase family 4 protein [Phycisphaerae bacterium]|jgi:hypothetical protein
MKRYDIAFLLGFPEISGGTNVILEHALGLTQRGHTVSIVTELPFDRRRLAWKPSAMDLPLLTHADCRGRRFDISLATWWRSVYDLPFVPARWYAYFCQSIESRFFSPQDSDIKALAEYTYRQPLPVVTEASWIARFLRDHYGREATLVLNGVDKRIFSPDGPALAPRPGDGIRVLVEGPLGVAFKRVEETIALCRQAGMRDIWLLTSSACERYPGVTRVCSRVPMAEVGAVYRACDVLVKLSTVEGMFGPPLEMMHCGGTAITSDVTGHDEYLRHGENGIVVPLGQEPEVIKYLRALERDRAFLDRLKAGARATAAAWPDWSAAVMGMEAFIDGVCRREPNMADAQADMNRQLVAALRLAGPLREQIRSDPSGRELLRRSMSKLRRKVARKLGLSREPTTAPPTDIAVLPAAERPAFRLSAGPWRVCFIGDERRFAAHVPRALADSSEVKFISTTDRTDGEIIAAVQGVTPDIVFLFEPQRVAASSLHDLPGYVVGYVVEPPRHDGIEALRKFFPAARAAARGVVCAAAEVATRLLSAGVFVLTARPVPVVLPVTDLSLEAWRSRPIDAVVLTNPTAGPGWSTVLHATPRTVALPADTPDAALAAILPQAKLAALLPGGSAAPALAAAKLAYAAACGCLVAASSVVEGYCLMAGEEFLYFESPEALVSQVRQSIWRPDPLDVMRRRALARVRALDAREAYCDLIRRHLLGGDRTPDWSGRALERGRPAGASVGGHEHAE